MYQVGDQVKILNTVPDHLRRYVDNVGEVIELAFDLFVVEVPGDQPAGFGESEIELVSRPEASGAPTLPGLVKPASWPGLEGRVMKLEDLVAIRESGEHKAQQKMAMRKTLKQWREDAEDWEPPADDPSLPTCPMHGEYLDDEGGCCLCYEDVGDDHAYET